MFGKSLDRRILRAQIKQIRYEAKEFRLRLKKARRTKNWGEFFDWWDEQESKKAI